MIAEVIIDLLVALLESEGHGPASQLLADYKTVISGVVRQAEKTGADRATMIASIKAAMTAASDAQMKSELGA